MLNAVYSMFQKKACTNQSIDIYWILMTRLVITEPVKDQRSISHMRSKYLTHYILVATYGDIGLVQHWFRKRCVAWDGTNPLPEPCRFIITGFLWNLHETNFTWSVNEHVFRNCYLELLPHLAGVNELMGRINLCFVCHERFIWNRSVHLPWDERGACSKYYCCKSKTEQNKFKPPGCNRSEFLITLKSQPSFLACIFNNWPARNASSIIITIVVDIVIIMNLMHRCFTFKGWAYNFQKYLWGLHFHICQWFLYNFESMGLVLRKNTPQNAYSGENL